MNKIIKFKKSNILIMTILSVLLSLVLVTGYVYASTQEDNEHTPTNDEGYSETTNRLGGYASPIRFDYILYGSVNYKNVEYDIRDLVIKSVEFPLSYAQSQEYDPYTDVNFKDIVFDYMNQSESDKLTENGLYGRLTTYCRNAGINGIKPQDWASGKAKVGSRGLYASMNVNIKLNYTNSIISQGKFSYINGHKIEDGWINLAEGFNGANKDLVVASGHALYNHENVPMIGRSAMSKYLRKHQVIVFSSNGDGTTTGGGGGGDTLLWPNEPMTIYWNYDYCGWTNDPYTVTATLHIPEQHYSKCDHLKLVNAAHCHSCVKHTHSYCSVCKDAACNGAHLKCGEHVKTVNHGEFAAGSGICGNASLPYSATNGGTRSCPLNPSHGTSCECNVQKCYGCEESEDCGYNDWSNSSKSCNNKVSVNKTTQFECSVCGKAYTTSYGPKYYVDEEAKEHCGFTTKKTGIANAVPSGSLLSCSSWSHTCCHPNNRLLLWKYSDSPSITLREGLIDGAAPSAPNNVKYSSNSYQINYYIASNSNKEQTTHTLTAKFEVQPSMVVEWNGDGTTTNYTLLGPDGSKEASEKTWTQYPDHLQSWTPCEEEAQKAKESIEDTSFGPYRFDDSTPSFDVEIYSYVDDYLSSANDTVINRAKTKDIDKYAKKTFAYEDLKNHNTEYVENKNYTPSTSLLEGNISKTDYKYMVANGWTNKNVYIRVNNAADNLSGVELSSSDSLAKSGSKVERRSYISYQKIIRDKDGNVLPNQTSKVIKYGNAINDGIRLEQSGEYIVEISIVDKARKGISGVEDGKANRYTVRYRILIDKTPPVIKYRLDDSVNGILINDQMTPNRFETTFNKESKGFKVHVTDNEVYQKPYIHQTSNLKTAKYVILNQTEYDKFLNAAKTGNDRYDAFIRAINSLPATNCTYSKEDFAHVSNPYKSGNTYLLVYAEDNVGNVAYTTPKIAIYDGTNNTSTNDIIKVQGTPNYYWGPVRGVESDRYFDYASNSYKKFKHNVQGTTIRTVPCLRLFINSSGNVEDISKALAITKVCDVNWSNVIGFADSKNVLSKDFGIYMNKLSDTIGLGYRVNFKLSQVGFGTSVGDKATLKFELYGKVGTEYKKLNIVGVDATSPYFTRTFVSQGVHNTVTNKETITENQEAEMQLNTYKWYSDTNKENSKLYFNYYIPATAQFQYENASGQKVAYTGSEILVRISELTNQKYNDPTAAWSYNLVEQNVWNTRSSSKELDNETYGTSRIVKVSNNFINGQTFWYDRIKTAMKDIEGNRHN